MFNLKHTVQIRSIGLGAEHGDVRACIAWLHAALRVGSETSTLPKNSTHTC